MFFNLGTIAKADQITESICSELTLSSKGIVGQNYHSHKIIGKITGDYLLLSERNNGRAVYRSKEKVISYQQRSFIYLYSFNATEYADNESYESLSDLTGWWVVRVIKCLIMNFFLLL